MTFQDAAKIVASEAVQPSTSSAIKRSFDLSEISHRYQHDCDEDEAFAHINIAESLAAFVDASITHWREIGGNKVVRQPDRDSYFAWLADNIGDTLEGISSGHLQAIYRAKLAHAEVVAERAAAKAVAS